MERGEVSIGTGYMPRSQCPECLGIFFIGRLVELGKETQNLGVTGLEGVGGGDGCSSDCYSNQRFTSEQII